MTALWKTFFFLSIYKKPAAYIIVSGEKWKAFPPRSCHFYSTQFRVLAKTIRQERETKGIYIRKLEVKLSLFTDGMILYVENSRLTPQKLLV